MKFSIKNTPGKNIKEKGKYITTKLYELGCVEENIRCTYHRNIMKKESYINIQPIIKKSLINKIKDFFKKLLK